MLQAQNMASVSLSQALSISPATIPLRAFPSEAEHSEQDKDSDVDSALTVSFVQALHEDSEESWQGLVEAVSTYHSLCTEGGGPLRRTQARLVHYLHRVFQHVERNSSRLQHLSIAQAVQRAFPELSSMALKRKALSSARPCQMKGDRQSSQEEAGQSATAAYFSQEMFDFKQESVPKTFQGQVVKTQDLLGASLATEEELRHFDKVFKKDTVTATDTLQLKLSPVPEGLPPLSPVYPSSTELVPTTKQEDMSHLLGPTTLLKSAVDVIRAFANGSLDGRVDFVYLNYSTGVESPMFDPYSLVVVSKAVVNPEHYVISRFGITHIYCDGTEESFTFAEWCSHTVVHRILREIPTFKRFFLQKMLLKWKRNVRSVVFGRRCRQLSKLTMRYFNDFSTACIKVKHLANEVLTLQLFEPRAEGSYTLEAFEGHCTHSTAAVRKPLLRLFKLCKQIVSELEAKKMSELQAVEAEVVDQPFVSDLPISQQREKALQMATRLEVARDHVSRLPSLALLVDRMLSSSLVALVQTSTAACVMRLLEAAGGNSLQSTAVEEDDTQPVPKSILQAVFSIQDTTGQPRLAMEPSWDTIRSSLVESLSQMSGLLVEVVQPTWRPTLGDDGGKGETTVHPHPVTLTPHTTSYREQLVSVMASRGVSYTAPPPTAPPPSHQQQQHQPDNVRKKGVPEEGSSRATEGGPLRSPLEKDNFKMLLLNCDPLVHSVQALEGAVMATEEELSCFLRQQVWLEEAHKYIVDSEVQRQTTPPSARELEVLLSQLEQWLHSAATLPNHFLPTSHLVSVDCSKVKQSIHAALERALSSLIARMHCSAQTQCRELSSKVDHYCKDLTAKRYDLEGFAEYTELVRQCQRYSSSTQPLVEGMEEVITVLTAHNINTGSLYTTLEETLERWSSFKKLLISGVAFVEKQTPLRAKGLEENIESHEEEVKSYLEQLNAGMFANPDSSAPIVLAELNKVQNDIRSLSSYMQGLSKWKEIISGSPHDLSLLHRLLALLSIRQELWGALHTCGALINEWSNTQFKKLNIAATVQKVEHWFESASVLSPTLPKEDPVLLAWNSTLKEFLGNLRLLQRLTSPAIKPHHWHSVFAAMGLPYDRSHRFTLSQLLDCSITEYIDNIVETCLKAEAEHKVEKTLTAMRERWESRRLTVKHFPSKPFSFAVTAIDKPHTGLKEKTATFALDTDQPPELLKETFCIVVDTENLVLWLEDDIMSLQVLLSSSHGESKVSGHVAHLLDLLQRVQEILSLMICRQTQWQHLLDLFQGFDSKQLASIDLSALKSATTKIQEVVGGVYSDTHVLSLVQKQHGQRGVRELQGNSLRKALYTLQQDLDDQMKVIEGNFMRARCLHSRLFFVSDRDTLCCMIPHASPLPILPLLRRCYPGVADMALVKMCSQDSLGQEDGYHVTSVKGHLGEELVLPSSLPLGSHTPVEWLPVLDQAVQLTLSCQLAEALLTVPEELHFSAEPQHPPDTSGAVVEWLQRHPSQCTALALEVTWARAITSCVDLSSTEDLRPALDRHLAAVAHCLQCFSSLMYQLPNKMADKTQRRKMFFLLGSLILLLRNKHDTVSRLLLLPQPLSASFEWQSLHQYHTSHTSTISEAASSSSVSKLAHTAKKGLTKTAAALTLTECHLTHLGRSVPYGFEFQGLGHRVFLLPEVERGVLDLLDCMQEEGAVFVAPTDNETSIDITRDVAQLLGRPYYSFLLPHCLTRTQACHLVLGIVGVGAVASLGGSGGLGAKTAALVARCVEELRTKLQEKVASRLVQGRSAESIVTTGSRQLRGAVSTTPGGGSDHSIPLYSTGSAHHQKVNWYSSPFPDCRGLEQVKVQLWGAELLASPTSLCCFSLGQGPLRAAGQGRLPQGVKEGARCVQWVSPDAVQLVQLLLLASGFQSGPALATALIDVWRELQLMVPAPLQRTIHNRHIYKDIIGTAEEYLLSLADSASEPYYLHSKAKEERAVLYGILALVRRRLSSVLHLGREVLPVCVHHWKEAVDYFRRAVSAEEALVVPEGEEYQVKELSTAVGRELRERHLQELPQLVEKCVALHHALQMGPAVLLWGGACSGKSTMYRILAAAYRGLRAEGGEDAYRQYPRVKTTVIHTKAHTLQELFGCQEDGRPSLLQMVAHQAGALQHTVESVTHPEASTYPRTNFEEVEDQCSAFQHWVILQGPLSHEAATLLAELVENDNIVYSLKAEPVSFPKSVKFIIELEDLPCPPCPSLLTSSSLVHSSPSTLPWKALVDTWLEEAKTAHNLNTSCQNILCAHMMEGFPLLLSKCCESPFYPCSSNQLVVLFLRFLSAVLTRSSSKMRALDGANDYGSLSHSSSLVSLSTSITDAPSSEEETNPSPSSASATRRRRRSSAYSVGGVSNASYGSSRSGHTSNVDLSLHMSMVFCYTAIWATYPVLATSDYLSSVEHDRFVRDVLSQLGLDGEIPSEGLVTDYFVDFKTCTFKTWKERCDGMTVNRNGYITVPEMLKASHFSEVLLSGGHNVILLGEHGMGKTASVKNQIESKLPLTRFCISPQTSPEQLRNSIMEKYGKSQRSMDMHKGLGLPAKVQKLLLFVDDIHLACLWETGSGSVEEMLHQAAAEGSVTDPDRSFQQGIQGVRFIASMVPSALSAFSSRFLCQFVPVLLPNLSSESVSTIFRARTSHWLKSALTGQLREDVVEQLANALVIASVTVHQNVASYTPATMGPQLPGVSLKEVMAIHSGMKYLSSHQGESKGFQATQRKTAVAGREKTLRTSRHRRQSSLAASNLPKPGRMKDELTKLARGRRKLKASLETEEEAARVVLLRSMVRLWCHETARVYGDRFSASKDCFWFANLINHVVKVAFCGPAGLKVVDLGTRAEQSTAIVTARRREKRLGRNLPVLPSTTPDDADDSNAALFEDIRRLGYDADLLSQAHLAGKLQQVIPLDQINLRGEDLSRLMFAPSTADGLEVPSTATNLDPSSTSLPPISSTAVIGQRQGHEEDREGEKGTATATVYKEMDDRDALSVVEGCVQRYSKEVSSSHEEVVPYRALVEQVLRMARALHLASSHAVLLGPRGAGKKTVCQLAACLMDYQVITLAQPNNPSQSQFLDCVRKACWSATAEGRGTALVVSGQLGLHQWNSLYLLMKEGDVESVFTGSEIIQMARQVQQSTSSFTRHLKYSDTLNTVKTSLEKNLHVMVCWTVQESEQGEADSKEVKDRVLSLLLRSAGCVGHLAPMDVEACSDIALRWLEIWTDSNWKASISFTGGISALSELAAHVHTTAARVASRKKGTRLTFTPRLFLTCLRMGYTLSLDLQQKEKESMEEAEDVLQALHEADVEVSDIAAHVAAAEGDVKAAQGLVEELMTAINSHKDEYLEASQRSKSAEAGIAKEGNRVGRLTEKLDEAMQQVSSQYNAALHSLSSVQKNDVLELMSYHSPPEALKSTLNALCIVFDRPESWEDCQQLLLVKNFFEHLQYFDRDNIPKVKLKYLKKMIASKRLDSAFVGRGSQAALPISSWLKALVAYHSAREVMLPHEEELKRARQALAEAKQTYSTKHYEMEETKAALERKIQEHRKALQRLRALERHLDQLRQIHSEATRLMSALLPLRESMEKKRDTAAALLHSSPSDGLLVAAAAVYLMTFDPTDQGELVQTWTRYCHGELEPGELAPSDLSGHYTHQGPEKIPLREDFSIVGAFVEEDYFKKGFSSLAKRMPVVSERLIIIKYLSSSPGLGVAPLVFDPHHYLFTLAKAQGKGGVVDAGSCVRQRRSSQSGQRQTRFSGRISRLSTCSEVLSLPGSSQQDSALPPLTVADQLSLKQIEETLSEEEVVYFIFSSTQAIRKEVLDFFTTHIRLNSTVNMAVVILQGIDTCVSCTDASMTSLFQLCMQQFPSSLSCCDPLFTIVDLQLGREDLEEFFRQKVMHALTPSLPIRHKAILADVATHISSIARAELQLKVAVVSSQSILQSRDSIHHLATSSTQISILAEQRLDDAKSQLTQYQKDIKIFHNAAQHCRLLSTCVASLSSYQPSFSLPLPLFDDLLGKAFKLNLVWQPKEFTSQAGLAATAVEQINTAVLPFVASCLSGRCFLHYLLIVCLEIWKQDVSKEEQMLISTVGSALVNALNRCTCEEDEEVQEEGDSSNAEFYSFDKALRNAKFLEAFPVFTDLTHSMECDWELWQEYFQNETCISGYIPHQFNSLSPSCRLLLWAVMCPPKLPEKIAECARVFVWARVNRH